MRFPGIHRKQGTIATRQVAASDQPGGAGASDGKQRPPKQENKSEAIGGRKPFLISERFPGVVFLARRNQSYKPSRQRGKFTGRAGLWAKEKKVRTNLEVPFGEHESARKLGARWDDVRKTWYVENVPNMIDFMRWMPGHLAGKTSRAVRKIASSRKGRK